MTNHPQTREWVWGGASSDSFDPQELKPLSNWTAQYAPGFPSRQSALQAGKLDGWATSSG
jgi:hypothetical protein